MSKQSYRYYYRRHRSWQNRGFHTTLALALTLFILLSLLVKQQIKPAQAQEPQPTPSASLRQILGLSLTNKQKPLITPLPIPTPTPSPVAEEIAEEIEVVPSSKWEEFELAARKVAKIYNFPVGVVLAQGRLESAYGNSYFCQVRNNCLGIGAYDHDPNQAFTFENQAQALVEYMRIIRSNFPTAWANRDNPELVIRYIKYDPATNLMYATDPNYVGKVVSMPQFGEK